MSELEHAAYNILKVMLVIILVMLLAIVGRTKAQDIPTVSQTIGTQQYVCRNGFYKTIRLELHNAPAMTQFAYNPDTDDAGFVGDVLAFDAHQNDPSVDQGFAAILDPSDWSVIASGDQSTSWCYGTPGYVDPVTLATPFPGSSDPCEMWAINGDTGGLICIWNLPDPTTK